MLRLGSRQLALTAATAVSALAVSKFPADAKAAPTTLRSLHEALATGPLGRRYTAASPLGASSWALSFAASDLWSNTRSVQVQVVDLETNSVGSPLPADGTVDVTRDHSHGLEMRQIPCDNGKKLAVEIWSGGDGGGVRLARRIIDSVGAKVLPPGVFGRPQFSPSGSRVVWVAEQTPPGADKPGYWSAAKKASDQRGGSDKGEEVRGSAEAPASAGPSDPVLEGRFALSDKRSTGEMLLVHGSVIVSWDWREDDVRVLQAADVLPAGAIPEPDGVGVVTHAAFDGTDDGLIFSCHLLPPWFPGLSACLNRPTKLFHLTRLFGATDAADAAEDSTAATAATTTHKAVCLTPDLYFAHMPRLSPNGSTLAFVSRTERFAGHSTAVELRTMRWPPPDGSPSSTVLVPVVATPEDDGFGGICGFHDELATLSWLNADSTLIFHTITGGTKATYTLDAATRRRHQAHSAAR
jgi:hypothetical protein